MAWYNVANWFGLTMASVEVLHDNTEIIWTLDDGRKFRMYHEQDCCEGVWIEDICGDLKDLVDAPLLVAEETTNHNDPKDSYDSCTWTFYRFGTRKGYVTIRWYGSSNGYYSEAVDIVEVK